MLARSTKQTYTDYLMSYLTYQRLKLFPLNKVKLSDKVIEMLVTLVDMCFLECKTNNKN